MKAKNIFSGLLFTALLGISSCDVLDTKSFIILDDDTVWGTKSSADAFVNGTIKSVMEGYINSHQITWENNTTNSVNNQGSSSLAKELYTRYDNDKINELDYFGTIRKCNQIITKAEEYRSKGLSDADADELIAKGKALRAITYFKQARTIGRFVWVDRVLTPADTLNNGLMLPTTKSTTESYTYLIKDLKEAVTHLPDVVKSGELTRNTGYAFLSEVALQAAAYETDAAKKKEWLQESINAADKVIQSGNHALATDYGNIFNEKDRFSSEIIFALYRDQSNTSMQDIDPIQQTFPNISNALLTQAGNGPLFDEAGNGRVFQGWLSHTPTQSLVDAFEVIDQSTGKAVRWNESSQFRNNFETSNTAPAWTVDSEKEEVLYSGKSITGQKVSDIIYANRDKRFYGTFVYDEDTYFNEYISMVVHGNLWRKAEGTFGRHIGVTNYVWRKGVYTIAPIYASTQTDYHFVVMRYARVLLNKAEALLWLAGMDGSGSISEAVSLCNQTRTIHGGLPESDASNLEQAWKLYQTERRCELTMENDYYWTLLRWGKHGGYANEGRSAGGKIAELATAPTYIEIASDRLSFYVGKVTFSDNDNRQFDENRRYLLPIPQKQIERNPNLGPNNPNW